MTAESLHNTILSETVVPLDQLPFFYEQAGSTDTFTTVFADQTKRLVTLCFDYCNQRDISFYLRGSAIDRAVLARHSGNNLDEIQDAVTRAHSYVPHADLWPSPIATDLLFSSGFLDIKVRATPQQLLDLYTFLSTNLTLPTTEAISTSPRMNQQLQAAYEHHKPQHWAELTHSWVPEEDSIPCIGLYEYSEAIVTPHAVTLKTREDWQQMYANPVFPLQKQRLLMKAVWITLDSKDTRDIDRSTPDRCYNIDGLQATLEPAIMATHTQPLQIHLPLLPDAVRLEGEALAYYQHEINAGNLVAMERFIEVTVRAMRKANTFTRKFDLQTCSVASALIDQIADYWTNPDFPHRHTDIHNQELQASAALDPEETLKLIHVLHLYKLMHPAVSAAISKITDIEGPEIKKILTDSYQRFGSKPYALECTLEELLCRSYGSDSMENNTPVLIKRSGYWLLSFWTKFMDKPPFRLIFPLRRSGAAEQIMV